MKCYTRGCANEAQVPGFYCPDCIAAGAGKPPSSAEWAQGFDQARNFDREGQYIGPYDYPGYLTKVEENEAWERRAIWLESQPHWRDAGRESCLCCGKKCPRVSFRSTRDGSVGHPMCGGILETLALSPEEVDHVTVRWS